MSSDPYSGYVRGLYEWTTGNPQSFYLLLVKSFRCLRCTRAGGLQWARLSPAALLSLISWRKKLLPVCGWKRELTTTSKSCRKISFVLAWTIKKVVHSSIRDDPSCQKIFLSWRHLLKHGNCTHTVFMFHGACPQWHGWTDSASV